MCAENLLRWIHALCAFFFLFLSHFFYPVFSYVQRYYGFCTAAATAAGIVVMVAAAVAVLVMMVCTFVSAFVLYLLFVLVRSFFYVVFLPLLRLLPRFCT